MKAHLFSKANPVYPVIALVLLLHSCGTGSRVPDSQVTPDWEVILERVTEKMTSTEAYFRDSTRNPRSVNPDGSIRMTSPKGWTSGFYPGVLWYTYALTGDSLFSASAAHHTELLEEIRHYSGTHDLGFMIFCSYGNGYLLGDREEYREVILDAARNLSSRFNPKVGAIKSWDWAPERWPFPVIIDNMMNLELLFWATAETGDSTFYRIADTHARTTLKHHFREDYSTWHVVDFDPASGEVRSKETHQGYSDESAWSRGQAWALYGYSMTFRETGDPVFLDQAEKIARFMMDHLRLPEDGIPYYDYDAPGIPEEPRDASAAAITASAMIELFGHTNREEYLEFADRILSALSDEPYFISDPSDDPFLLRHSTGSKPGPYEVDAPIIYADYYFVEALFRRLALEQN